MNKAFVSSGLLAVCLWMTLGASVSFASKIPIQEPPPPPPRQEVRPEQDFVPTVTVDELQRSIILGNPPRQPREYRFQPPVWLKRPEAIPSSYQLRQNNGINFE